MMIKLFGSLGEAIGREIEGDIPGEGCSLAALRERLATAYPRLADRSIRASVDQVVVGDEAIVRPDQEVAFFPPLSGG